MLQVIEDLEHCGCSIICCRVSKCDKMINSSNKQSETQCLTLAKTPSSLSYNQTIYSELVCKIKLDNLIYDFTVIEA